MSIENPLAKKIITRTELENFNWQAMNQHGDYSREILASGRPSLDKSKVLSYQLAIESIIKERPGFIKSHFYFVIENESFFQTEASIDGMSAGQQVIVHSFKLTPIRVSGRKLP